MNTEDVNTHHLRGHAFKLYLPKPRTDVMKFSYVYRVVNFEMIFYHSSVNQIH